MTEWHRESVCAREKEKVVEICNGDWGASCIGESPHAAVFTNRPSLSLSPCIAGCCLHTASSVLLPPTQRSHLHLVMLFWLSVSWNSFLICVLVWFFVFPLIDNFFLIFFSLLLLSYCFCSNMFICVFYGIYFSNYFFSLISSHIFFFFLCIVSFTFALFSLSFFSLSSVSLVYYAYNLYNTATSKCCLRIYWPNEKLFLNELPDCNMIILNMFEALELDERLSQAMSVTCVVKLLLLLL